ncbi:glycosyltransferase family 1 [Opitutaceae bacterium TAV5]|nr:glycosyltransferase family 1 [Opitutaceae bacterium TAV5]
MKTKIRLHFLFSIALAGCALASSAKAAVSVSLSATAPTEDVYKFQEIPSGGTASNVTAYKRVSSTILERTVGQGFSTESETGDLLMTAVTFKIYNFSDAVEGLDFTISLYEGTSITAASPASATLLSRQTGTLPETLVTGNYITFDLGTPVTLSPDKYYSVVYSFAELTSSGSTANSIGFATIGSGNSNTTGGRRWLGDDGTYTGSTSNGLVLYVHAVAVPEPATWALLFGIFAAALAIVRKRLSIVS